MISDIPAVVDPYKGKRIDPDILMDIMPVAIFSFNGYHRRLQDGQRLYRGESWLRELTCEGCGVTGYDILSAYRSKDLAKFIGEPLKGQIILPCTDCGTIFQSYQFDEF